MRLRAQAITPHTIPPATKATAKRGASGSAGTTMVAHVTTDTTTH